MKDVFVVCNYSIDNSIAVRMTKEQASAIDWFIDWADLEDFSIGKPDDMAIDLEYDYRGQFRETEIHN